MSFITNRAKLQQKSSQPDLRRDFYGNLNEGAFPPAEYLADAGGITFGGHAYASTSAADSLRQSPPLTSSKEDPIATLLFSTSDFLTKMAIIHPCAVMRRQCQVHQHARSLHITPFTLIPVAFNMASQHGLSTFWRGSLGAGVVWGMSAVTEVLVSDLFGLPRSIVQGGSQTKFLKHIILKAYFIFGSRDTSRKFSLLHLAIPTVTMRTSHYLIQTLVKGRLKAIAEDYVVKYDGFFDCIRSIVREEGFAALYAGVGAVVLQWLLQMLLQQAIRACFDRGPSFVHSMTSAASPPILAPPVLAASFAGTTSSPPAGRTPIEYPKFGELSENDPLARFAQSTKKPLFLNLDEQPLNQPAFGGHYDDEDFEPEVTNLAPPPQVEDVVPDMAAIPATQPSKPKPKSKQKEGGTKSAFELDDLGRVLTEKEKEEIQKRTDYAFTKELFGGGDETETIGYDKIVTKEEFERWGDKAKPTLKPGKQRTDLVLDEFGDGGGDDYEDFM